MYFGCCVLIKRFKLSVSIKMDCSINIELQILLSNLFVYVEPNNVWNKGTRVGVYAFTTSSICMVGPLLKIAELDLLASCCVTVCEDRFHQC